MPSIITGGLGGPYSVTGGLSPLKPDVSIRAAVVACLKADAQAAITAGGRIYPGKVPGTVQPGKPAITYLVYSVARARHLGGPTGTARAKVQLAACSRDPRQVACMATDLRQLLDGYRSAERGLLGGLAYVQECQLLDERDFYEKPDPKDPSDQGVFRTLLTFKIQYREPLGPG